MSAVAGRYARALLDALAPDGIAGGLVQLRSVDRLFQDQPDALRLLLNPAVSSEDRERFIQSVSRVLDLAVPVERLLGLLVERRRLEILADLIDEYQKLSDERNGIVRALVTTVNPLGESERLRLVQRLQAVTGKQVVIEVRQDPAIIGGVVVQMGSTVFDASLRQHLTGFKARLLAG